MPLKTPLKPSGKIQGENDMAYKDTCVYIVSLKTFYEKPLGKNSSRGKGVQYMQSDGY